MKGKEVGHGPVCGRCLVVSRIIEAEKGFYAVCAGCNISEYGGTAGEADYRFAMEAMKYKRKKEAGR